MDTGRVRITAVGVGIEARCTECGVQVSAVNDGTSLDTVLEGVRRHLHEGDFLQGPDDVEVCPYGTILTVSSGEPHVAFRTEPLTPSDPETCWEVSGRRTLFTHEEIADHDMVIVEKLGVTE